MVRKRNLKEHLTDDTLDLSLSELQTVPVKEIAAIPKATCLDLSSNQLTSLGANFAPSLTHLVKLDICRNQLTELPENFGLLINLKYLDLYRNKLQTLPISFCNLRHLRWLDLKENPLVPKMMQVAGPCLDAQGCQFAARKVVKFLGELSREIEAEKLRKLAEEKKREEKDLEQAQKKEPKKKKKKKNQTKLMDGNREQLTENGNAIVEVTDSNKVNCEKNGIDKKKNIFVPSHVQTFMKICMLLLFIGALSFYFISTQNENVSMNSLVSIIKAFIILGNQWCLEKLPSCLWIYFDQMRTLLLTLFAHVLFLIQHCVQIIIRIYNVIILDQQFQLYLQTTKENILLLYSKTADIIIENYNVIISYAETYFK